MQNFQLTASKYIENDGSVTLVLNEIDLVENATDEASAKLMLAESLFEYAEDYRNELELYSRSPNRSGHMPIVQKVLEIGDAERLAEQIAPCARVDNT